VCGWRGASGLASRYHPGIVCSVGLVTKLFYFMQQWYPSCVFALMEYGGDIAVWNNIVGFCLQKCSSRFDFAFALMQAARKVSEVVVGI
jgi:hypothetical protein